MTAELAVSAKKVDTLAIPLERDVFLRTLNRELSGTLQDVVGLEEAAGFVGVVGQRRNAASRRGAARRRHAGARRLRSGAPAAPASRYEGHRITKPIEIASVESLITRRASG